VIAEYLRETPDGKFLFIMDRRWTGYDFQNSTTTVYPHEEFLEDFAPDQWYYGGNRYLARDRFDDSEQNRCIVVTALLAATAFRLSDHVS
jgi:hypothetical protein